MGSFLSNLRNGRPHNLTMDNLPCPMCNFEGDRPTLENHVKKTHLKWFPYECAYCEHMAVSHALQEVHRLNVHPDKQAKVIYCGNDLIEKQLVEILEMAEKKAKGEEDTGPTSVVDSSRARLSPVVMSAIRTETEFNTGLSEASEVPAVSPKLTRTRKRKGTATKSVQPIHNPPPLPEPQISPTDNGHECEEPKLNIDATFKPLIPQLNTERAPGPHEDNCRFCYHVFPSVGVECFFRTMDEKLEHMQTHMNSEFQRVVPMLEFHDRLNRLGAVCFTGFDLDKLGDDVASQDIKPTIMNVVNLNGLSHGLAGLYEQEGAPSYPSSVSGFEREASDSMSESMETSAMDDMIDTKPRRTNNASNKGDADFVPTHGGRRLKMTECRICKESFNTAKMSHHVWQHHFHTKIYQCGDCSYATAQGRSNVYMHWKKHHKGQPQINDRRNEFIKEYKAIYEKCYGTLPRNQNGVIRVRQMKRDSNGAPIQAKGNFCLLCSTNVIQNAYAHVWMKHVGEKGFVCDLCPYKAFARDQAVDHWLRNHDGEPRINDIRDDFRDEFRDAWTACFPDKHVA